MVSSTGIAAARYWSCGGSIYAVRPYKPEFLWLFGVLHEIRQMRPDSAQRILTQARLFLQTGVIDSENNQKEWGLNKAANAAQTMMAFLNPIFNDILENKATDVLKDREQFDATKKLIVMWFDNFESNLLYDVGALHIQVLEKKKGYSVDTLMGDIEDVLPPDDRGQLSDFARENMQEAGACLVCDRFTASGYHMSRAVEDVARRYYEAVTGRPSQYVDKNGEPRHRTLAQIAEELQDVLNNWKGTELGLLPLIVPTLRQFCRIYRHRLSHADPDLKTLNANAAEVAFGHAISAISTMLEDGRAGGPHFQTTVVWRT